MSKVLKDVAHDIVIAEPIGYTCVIELLGLKNCPSAYVPGGGRGVVVCATTWLHRRENSAPRMRREFGAIIESVGVVLKQSA